MLQFRTKARAVDLLGKGQIADLPTAITELWKNGFDAYADNLTAELFLVGYKNLEQPLFLLTDDGKGMSRNDIFEKWLVLGTDSKSRTNSEEIESEETLWKKPRIKAGEKGIGRLSVAFLGSPMLMLTKKRGYPLQALYFDWRLLENYNLFLDDILIPIEDVDSATDINKVFQKLKDEYLENFEKVQDLNGKPVWEESQRMLRENIINVTKKLELPVFFSDEILADIVDINDDNGTKFVIFNPEQQIIDLLNPDPDDNYSEFVRSSLAGFTNQFKTDPLPLETKFPIHRAIGDDYDFLTGSGNFFSPSDFDSGDILIDGTFNGNGSFKGHIRMYDELIEYNYTSTRKKDKRSDYGAFNLKLGYLLGKENESSLNDLAYKRLEDKVTLFGALYIYRDGFRVLPYGRTDYDFLEFEKKRSKRASTYFFSHRRMFGYIEIGRKQNEHLKDKSGREGFINNAPYRAFQSDLQGFFDELAKEYFSDKARSPIFKNKKADLKTKNDTLKKDKERERIEKSAFTRSLKDYPPKFASYQASYNNLLADLDEKVKNSNSVYSDIENILDQLNKLDIEYKNLLPEIPKRYKPTDTQLDRLSSYEKDLENFNDRTKKASASLIRKAKSKLQIHELKKEFTKSYSLYKAELEKIIYENREKLKRKVSSISSEFDERTLNIVRELDYQKTKAIADITDKQDVIIELDKIKDKFEFLREQINNEITPLITHILRLDFDIDEELVQGIYKDEYDKIQYQWEQTRETAQLGVAIEIIDHEFNVLYSQINASLKKLDSEFGQNATSTYKHLKSIFSLLEDKYELLSPLYRIAGATPKEISGESIYEYLQQFFDQKLAEENIEFDATNSFKKHIILIKEPVIHTAFINIVNNAIYWLRNCETRKILLDFSQETNEILILNSGQPIPEHRIKRIFELFYSNRPNGRGIGLYLAKQSLEENSFELYATNESNYNQLNGACFVIKKIN